MPVFHADYVPNVKVANHILGAFCGLGAPHHFFDMLREAGAELVFQREFRDHHSYTASDLSDLQIRAEKAGAEALATTPKDAVKMESGTFRIPLMVIDAELKIQEQEAWDAFLKSKLPLPGSSTEQA